MAIIVEEERHASGSWGSILLWGMVFLIVGVAVYYIFVKRPDLVEVSTPQNFQNAVQLSKIHLDPGEVVNSAQFKSLQTYAAPLSPSVSGRTNPFLGNF